MGLYLSALLRVKVIGFGFRVWVWILNWGAFSDLRVHDRCL